MSLLLDCRKYCLTYGLLSCQALIVGVSGGSDSMCLLDILYSLSEESKKNESLKPFPQIIAAHVNHCLRGEAADHDEDIVRQYCRERFIPFAAGRIDIQDHAQKEKISLEQAGRSARYKFFDETAHNYLPDSSVVYTAVAHHREDQAETILMNLFRGTGPDGLCGMKPKSGDIIRPLLFASKEDILFYLEAKMIPYSDDLSNFDNTYTRNRWRNQILPLIADVSRKDPVLPLLSLAELVSTDKEYFDEKVFEIYKRKVRLGGSGTFGLPCAVIRNEHRSIASRLVRLLYSERFSSATDLTAAHVSAILSLAAEGTNGGRISLAHGKTAYLAEGELFIDAASGLTPEGAGTSGTWSTKGGQILLCREETKGAPLCILGNITANRVVSISKTYFDVEVILVENMEQVVYNSRTWYCPAAMLAGTVFRTKRQGDWFSRSGSTGGKPLRRFLTDRKIPVFVRDRMLLAANESQVLWIPGVSFAAGFADEVSGRRYFDSYGLEMTEYSVRESRLYRITILDTNEQEEH